MAYTRYHEQWDDLPLMTTPVDKAALEHIEGGVEAVSTDADYTRAVVDSGRLSEAAISAVIAADVEAAITSDKGEGLMTALDQKRSAVLAVLSDSTALATHGEWPALLAAHEGDRYTQTRVQHHVYSSGSYAAPTVVSPGTQSAVVGADTFARVAADLNGSTPDTGGGAWASSSSGKYELDGSAAMLVPGATSVTAHRLPSTAPGRMTATVDWSVLYDGGSPNGTSWRMLSSYVNSGTFLWIEAIVSSVTITFKKSTTAGGTVNLGTKTFAEAGITADPGMQPLTMSIAHVGDDVTFTVGAASETYALTSVESETFALGASCGFWGSGNAHGVTEITATADIPATTTFDVYNGAVGSTKADYPITRIPQMIPVPPDAVLVSYSHNHTTETPLMFEGALDGLVAAIRAHYPEAGIIVGGQNPQYAPTANPAEHNARQADLRRYARARGFGYAPVYEAFMSNINPQAGIKPDGVHPNATGAQRWADAVAAHLDGLSLKG